MRELKARDREVRAHEEAHKATAGDLAIGGPTYDFEEALDGQEYAVGGEVQISLRPGRTPEETASNAQRARRAALAPAQPSAQNHKVAAQAAQMEAEARQEAREAEANDETEGAEAATEASSTDRKSKLAVDGRGSRLSGRILRNGTVTGTTPPRTSWRRGAGVGIVPWRRGAGVGIVPWRRGAGVGIVPLE